MAKFWCWLFGHKLVPDPRPGIRFPCYRCLRWVEIDESARFRPYRKAA